jgi:hypothetical protein
MSAGDSEVAPLTVREVLRLGGWGSVPSARLRALATFGAFAFSATDTNGDGVEMDNESWAFVDGEWRSGGSHGTTFHRTGRAYLGQGAATLVVKFRVDTGEGLVDLEATRVGVWSEP